MALLWHPFERGFRAATRKPYQELEVLPVPAGWRWTVSRIVPRSGSFRMVGHGVAKTSELARKAAEEASK